MDSIEITILRTGAATAVAAKYLAREDAYVATICGCGNQGRISLKALTKVRPIEQVYAFDIDHHQAERFAAELAGELRLEAQAVRNLPDAVRPALPSLSARHCPLQWSIFMLQTTYVSHDHLLPLIVFLQKRDPVEVVLMFGGKRRCVVDVVEFLNLTVRDWNYLLAVF